MYKFDEWFMGSLLKIILGVVDAQASSVQITPALYAKQYCKWSPTKSSTIMSTSASKRCPNNAMTFEDVAIDSVWNDWWHALNLARVTLAKLNGYQRVVGASRLCVWKILLSVWVVSRQIPFWLMDAENGSLHFGCGLYIVISVVTRMCALEDVDPSL